MDGRGSFEVCRVVSVYVRAGERERERARKCPMCSDDLGGGDGSEGARERESERAKRRAGVTTRRDDTPLTRIVTCTKLPSRHGACRPEPIRLHARRHRRPDMH